MNVRKGLILDGVHKPITTKPFKWMMRRAPRQTIQRDNAEHATVLGMPMVGGSDVDTSMLRYIL